MFHERRVFHVGLGAELKRLRELNRLSTRTVATKLGTSAAWVSRTETGARRPSVDDVKALCAIYGATGELRERLVHKARDIHGDVAHLPPSDEFADQLANIMVLESEATKITDFGVSLVPGLLQTAGYARQMISTLDRPESEVERRVSTRIGRQALFTRPNGPEANFIIDEMALRRRIGGAEVMRAQLQHLISCADLPKVGIWVIPVDAGAYTGLEGPFAAYEFATLDPYVYLENRKGGIFLTRKEETCEYLDVCKELRGLSLDGSESLKLIKSIAKGLRND